MYVGYWSLGGLNKTHIYTYSHNKKYIMEDARARAQTPPHPYTLTRTH